MHAVFSGEVFFVVVPAVVAAVGAAAPFFADGDRGVGCGCCAGGGGGEGEFF